MKSRLGWIKRKDTNGSTSSHIFRLPYLECTNKAWGNKLAKMCYTVSCTCIKKLIVFLFSPPTLLCSISLLSPCRFPLYLTPSSLSLPSSHPLAITSEASRGRGGVRAAERKGSSSETEGPGQLTHKNTCTPLYMVSVVHFGKPPFCLILDQLMGNNIIVVCRIIQCINEGAQDDLHMLMMTVSCTCM